MNPNAFEVNIEDISLVAQDGVFSLNSPGMGDDAFAGNFTITESPPGSGVFFFTPTPNLQSGQTGTIIFTFNVLALPVPNPTIIEVSVAASPVGGGDPVFGFDTDTVLVLPAVICVAKDTMVLMSNGKEKPIQKIKRGDYVASNLQCTMRKKVARLIKSETKANTRVSIIKMAKDAIGPNQPNSDLIMTSGHPILYNGNKHRAKYFKNFKGVKYYSKNKTKAEHVLPPENDNTYCLYNIQFETDGYFIVNGLIVDSVPTNSKLFPLPKELYFHKRLYTNNILNPLKNETHVK